MKILHTSDWHLGRSLYKEKRDKEFTQFLAWLITTIEAENIDILLVAGDIFDTTTPSYSTQKLYYDFLTKVAKSCCRHIVIIAGNHDSPSCLNAPKQLLQAFDIHVIAAVSESLADEVIVLYNNNQQPELIVCAVPYLRDKDIRTVEAGETIEDKNSKLIAGIKNHYTDVCDIAEQQQNEFNNAGYNNIPIVAMGHLFTSGAKTVDGDGVRDLYVGSIAHIGKNVFPETIDYLALGHLHVAQTVGNAEHIRYCGSPIPMGYGEANQQKQVVIIEFNHDSTKPNIKELAIPCFQQLVRISGSLDDIQTKIEELKQQNSCAWLEIEYTVNEVIANINEILNQSIVDSAIKILRLKTNSKKLAMSNSTTIEETLEDMQPIDVFTRYLDTAEITNDEKRQQLINSHNEIIKSLNEEDVNKE